MNRYYQACELWPDNIFDLTQVGCEVYVDAAAVYNGYVFDDRGNVTISPDGTETKEQRELLAFVDGVIGF